MKEYRRSADKMQEAVDLCIENFGLEKPYVYMVGTGVALRVDEILVDGFVCEGIIYYNIPFAPIDAVMAHKIKESGSYTARVEFTLSKATVN